MRKNGLVALAVQGRIVPASGSRVPDPGRPGFGTRPRPPPAALQTASAAAPRSAARAGTPARTCVRAVCRRYFGVEAEYLGYVNRDEAVREAVQSRRPLLEVRPRSDAAVYVRRIAGKLLEAARR